MWRKGPTGRCIEAHLPTAPFGHAGGCRGGAPTNRDEVAWFVGTDSRASGASWGRRPEGALGGGAPTNRDEVAWFVGTDSRASGASWGRRPEGALGGGAPTNRDEVAWFVGTDSRASGASSWGRRPEGALGGGAPTNRDEVAWFVGTDSRASGASSGGRRPEGALGAEPRRTATNSPGLSEQTVVRAERAWAERKARGGHSGAEPPSEVPRATTSYPASRSRCSCRPLW